MKSIKRNRIQCGHCHDIIESVHRHDFQMCKCGKTSVDGGTDYLRRIGSKFIELSEYINEPGFKHGKVYDFSEEGDEQ